MEAFRWSHWGRRTNGTQGKAVFRLEPTNKSVRTLLGARQEKVRVAVVAREGDVGRNMLASIVELEGDGKLAGIVDYDPLSAVQSREGILQRTFCRK